jgi:hypothetical protein
MGMSGSVDERDSHTLERRTPRSKSEAFSVEVLTS